MKLRIKK